MPNHLILLPELEVTLLDSIANVPAYYTMAQKYFELLYSCGCRPLEPMQIAKWIDGAGSSVTLLALKGNNPRTIQKVTLPPFWLTAITNQVNPFPSNSYIRFRYAFKHSYIYPAAYTGDKDIALYLFRHYQFKKLHNLGMSDNDIKVYMGENNIGVTQNYIYSEIWSGG